MIEKVIHYCWFGNNKKPKIIKKCIKSWKKYCPDFKIIEWNEENFDVFSSTYSKQANEQKKWAFVSDYARHKILFENGGIYLDTDVELIKPLDNNLLSSSFLAIEKTLPSSPIDNLTYQIATGLIMGVKKGDKYCEEMIKQYENEEFIKDKKMNLETVCVRTTKYFSKIGFENKDENQKVGDYNIYASEYFCPKDFKTGKINITKNTIGIHHYAASWLSLPKKIKHALFKILGQKLTNKLVKLKKLLKRGKNE